MINFIFSKAREPVKNNLLLTKLFIYDIIYILINHVYNKILLARGILFCLCWRIIV